MSGSDAFGGCLGIVAAGILGLVFGGPLGALLGALISAVVVGLVLSSRERATARRTRSQGRAGGRSSTASAADIPTIRADGMPAIEDALKRLDELQSNGLITPDEYASKRRDILNRL